MTKMKSLAFAGIIMTAAAVTGCKKDSATTTATVDMLSAITPGSTFYAPFSMKDYLIPSSLQVVDSNFNVTNSIAVPVAALNFRKWTFDGTIRYTYHVLDPSVAAISGVGYTPGWSVILDQNLQELKRVKLQPYNGRAMTDATALDAHDFILLGDDHYLAMAYYEKSVTNIDARLNPVAGCKLVVPIIQEVQNGSVIWEWDGSKYPEFYANSVEGNDFTNTSAAQDYMHLNSMFVDAKDNNLVCSFRNQNQVIKINRSTGDIVWRLGGKNSDFTMTDDQRFLRQHDATITDDGTLLLVDNGDATERPYTRIAELKLDESSKTITSYKSLDMPDHLFCQYMGSVQKTAKGTYFIGCGSVPRVIEMNYTTGQVVLDKTTSGGVSYRALRY